jgi:hypothetical protein
MIEKTFPAAAPRVEIFRNYLYRMGITVWKTPHQ